MSKRNGSSEAQSALPGCASFSWMTGLLWAGVLAASWLAAGCGILGAPRYTKASDVRPDQKWWIKQDLALILARHLSAASRRNPEVVDAQVAADLNTVLQICYRQGSYGGVDVDGGVRAMNFFKRAYFEAEGDYWTWRAAVRDRRRRPQGEDDPFYPSVIPRGYQ